jgi:hypothetical protein
MGEAVHQERFTSNPRPCHPRRRVAPGRGSTREGPVTLHAPRLHEPHGWIPFPCAALRLRPGMTREGVPLQYATVADIQSSGVPHV